ncbi:unnamed protein product [marine sediment metagenome]|uniref:Uncharacterized protein n=1 Tax=marine sediment metagenome TaxID=412755 RepID=X1MUC6_9ZZZZ
MLTGILTSLVALGYFFVTRGEENLSIATFNVDDIYYVDVEGENTPALSLYIDDYGVTGNTVWVNGTVNYIARSDYHATGANVGMAIKRHASSSVEVEVFLWGGILVWGSTTIADDTVNLPTLGGTQTLYPQLFNFQLSATVPLPVPYSRT